MPSRERAGHPGYAAVWKGNRTSTPGGLQKKDIIRQVIKGPAKGPKRYKYISRARHDAAVRRMKKEGLPAGFVANMGQIEQWNRAAGRH